MMDRNRKRAHRDESSSSSSNIDHRKKPYSRNSASDPHREICQDSQQQDKGKRPTFTSYLETPNLSPKLRLLCEIVANTSSSSVEKVLDDTGVRVSHQDVEQVLKLSYSFPGCAVKFFRWSGYQLTDKHSPYSWNLVIDLLGKNFLFDAMWDAIKSMKKEGLLSLATFASVFSSYVSVDRVHEAIMAFEVMDQYGIPHDIVALNSLLSAICREGKNQQAKEFVDVAKSKIRPDVDTYAILLEGWENETNVVGARQTFTEMVNEIGWNPGNVPAYDSFLCTLLKGPNGIHEAMKFLVSMIEMSVVPGIKFFKLALEDCVRSCNPRDAELLWDIMVGKNRCKPDTKMYNSMISLKCYFNESEIAMRFLDEMVCNGVFPDSETYNILFRFLIKSKRLKEALPIFSEMIKNECFPSQENCGLGIKYFVENGEPYMALKVWKWMIENFCYDLEGTGNFLILHLREINRMPEAVKYAEDMIDRGIKLNSSTLSKLKQSLSKAGKIFVYDELLRKWKAAVVGLKNSKTYDY